MFYSIFVFSPHTTKSCKLYRK